MQGAGIALQIQSVLLPTAGIPGQEHIPMIDVNPLDHLSVHKQQKLRILGIIPFLNLSSDIQPQRLPVKGFRHSHPGSEPAVPVRAVPVILSAVKRKESSFSGRLLGRNEVSFSHFPTFDQLLLSDGFLFQFVADNLGPLVQKKHRHIHFLPVFRGRLYRKASISYSVRAFNENPETNPQKDQTILPESR